MSTTPGYKKKLIEVALPLDEINKQSAREKSIRHGHPSTLHLWWARRPLAACRAVLFAQLVDDPSARPEEFPTEEDQALERKRLFEIIEQLVNWDNINDKALYEEAREKIWKSCGGNPPPILDPFAGGGSIPLEAQRLGLESHASDLNPVPVIINKALIEIPPKWSGIPPVFPGVADSRLGEWPGATGLAEDVNHYGQWIWNEARKRIGHLYPKAKLADGSEAEVIAWIWARTAICPNPACSGKMPLIKSFWLSKKKGMERFLEPITKGNKVRFEVRGPKGEPREGTIGRTGATCLFCNTPAPLSYLREEGKEKRIGSQLMAKVVEHKRVRYYLPPSAEDEFLSDIPAPEDAPDSGLSTHPQYMGTPRYGMTHHSDLFTKRQLIALTVFGDLIEEARARISADARDAGLPVGEGLNDGGVGSIAYADAVATYLALGLSRMSDISNALCRWENTKTQVRNLFGRQAIPMIWDYAETQPFSSAAGGFMVSLGNLIKALRTTPANGKGTVNQVSALSRSYEGLLVSTDPPYYDNVPYADLSDFFYVWLRRSLRPIFPELFGTVLTPKAEELVADQRRLGGREKATKFFEDGFQKVFTHVKSGTPSEYPMTVFYAFKQSESDGAGEASTGWETLLEGMIRSGWSITATWPIRTELSNRMRGLGSNALASSIVLACRPRLENAGVIDRRSLINELKMELPKALRDLQHGGIAPVDLDQSAIGPGMAIFSKYSQVTEADGSPMPVRAALVLINQILDEVLSDQEGDFDSDTRFCIKWFKTYGFDTGPFGIAENLAKTANTAVSGLDRSGVLNARAGIVRLVSPDELPKKYNPMTDDRISVWEIVMHLARQLDTGGLDASARLMAAARNLIDLDIAKELTYLLYSICEKRKWAETGLLFNELGVAWSDIEQVAHTVTSAETMQVTLDYPEED